MFNNSSLLSPGTGETSEGDFTRRVPCILWHLQNKSSYDQAHEACSAFTDFMELGTGMAVVFWLVGLCIIISNAAVLWGIIRAPELRKQLSFLMANLAVADMLAVIPVCRLAGEKCPLPRAETGVALMVVLNSAVNPAATIIRTPDIRKTIRQDVTAIYEALVTMMRGNRVNPQDEETPQNQRGGTGAASGSERNMPIGQPATEPKVTRSNQVMADCLDQEIVELD
ncbi:Gamma-tubulin complex component 5 [Branchiostoma belcheri]|nr:Gamma-tubulin complex component 5 [Branchiostoma belcheri]